MMGSGVDSHVCCVASLRPMRRILQPGAAAARRRLQSRSRLLLLPLPPPLLLLLRRVAATLCELLQRVPLRRADWLPCALAPCLRAGAGRRRGDCGSEVRRGAAREMRLRHQAGWRMRQPCMRPEASIPLQQGQACPAPDACCCMRATCRAWGRITTYWAPSCRALQPGDARRGGCGPGQMAQQARWAQLAQARRRPQPAGNLPHLPRFLAEYLMAWMEMALKFRLRCAAARSSRWRLSTELLLVGAAAGEQGPDGGLAGHAAGADAAGSWLGQQWVPAQRPPTAAGAPGRRGGRCSWLGVLPSPSSAASLLLAAGWQGGRCQGSDRCHCISCMREHAFQLVGPCMLTS